MRTDRGNYLRTRLAILSRYSAQVGLLCLRICACVSVGLCAQKLENTDQKLMKLDVNIWCGEPQKLLNFSGI